MDREQQVAYWQEAKSLANIACWTIELQIKLLERDEHEIPEFVLQKLADFHFLVTAISRLRKAADLACQASDISNQIKVFDDAVPDWRKIRNALEHIDEYWLGTGRSSSICPGTLPVMTFGPVIRWAGLELNLRETMAAAHALVLAIRGVWPPSDPAS